MTLDDLTTPTWWLTAVIGAVVLKVISDYTKTGIEKAFSKGQSAWSSRSKASRERFNAEVDYLRSHREIREIYFQRELRIRSQANFSLLMSSLSAITLTLYYLLAIYPNLEQLRHRQPLSWDLFIHDPVRAFTVVVAISYCISMIVTISGAFIGQMRAQAMSRTLRAATKNMFPREGQIVSDAE
ncbi:hypothetical protein NDN94_07830 [Burkholderia glumae]|uniref:hypothetical protein n=1 Tax=Burkholderia glumae TaxID=337 RepID=UPI00203698BA|nr:hypothetical protein [Burkholderia glumae]MCM2537737.1 hypothetical protein [Burkholderia glumae]